MHCAAALILPVDDRQLFGSDLGGAKQARDLFHFERSAKTRELEARHCQCGNIGTSKPNGCGDFGDGRWQRAIRLGASQCDGAPGATIKITTIGRSQRFQRWCTDRVEWTNLTLLDADDLRAVAPRQWVASTTNPY